jgi:hypothetical protein
VARRVVDLDRLPEACDVRQRAAKVGAGDENVGSDDAELAVGRDPGCLVEMPGSQLEVGGGRSQADERGRGLVRG